MELKTGTVTGVEEILAPPPPPPPVIYICPACGLEFNTQELLDAHILTFHPVIPPPPPPPPPPTPITAVFKPGQNSDDCYVYPDSLVDGLNLWFGNPSGQEIIDMGIRVVDTTLPGNVLIPQGAKILSAKFTFQSNSWYDGVPCNVQFRGQLLTNAPTFGKFDDFKEYLERKRTVAYIEWNNVPPFIGKVDYESPDLSPIIQEIVNLPGGCGSSLVLFCIDNVSHQAFRGCYPFNRTTTLCPRLTVTWTI